MTKYLISFPSKAMQLSEDEFARAGVDSRAVIEQAKTEGVCVFGGGIDEGVDAMLAAADGSVSGDIYPASHLDGGFTVLELPSRQAAEEWARRMAVACRCSQELREFMYGAAASRLPPKRQPRTRADRKFLPPISSGLCDLVLGRQADQVVECRK
jgi:hypothetical protein